MKLFLDAVLTLILITGITFVLPAAAQDSPFNASSAKLPIVRRSVLPVDEAFAMNALIEAPDTLVLFWEIKDGYYLYRKSISVSDADGRAIEIGELPAGTLHTDEFFGAVNIFTARLLHRIPLSSLAMENHKLGFTVHYQGCAEDLYCYPMQMKEFELTLPE